MLQRCAISLRRHSSFRPTRNSRVSTSPRVPTHLTGINFAASVPRPHAGTITCQTRTVPASSKSERSTTAHQMLTPVQPKSSSQRAASTELAMLLGSLSSHFAKPSPYWIYAGPLRRKWGLPRRYIPGLAPERALGHANCTTPIPTFRASTMGHR